MKLYRQISTKENPLIAGWYNTDKGELFWFKSETLWSCRDDRVSEEYPNVWYDEVLPQADIIKSVCDHVRESDGMICIGGRCSKCNEIV